MSKKILILIGSPKPRKESACVSVAERFIKCFSKKGFKVETVNVPNIIKSEEGKKDLLALVNVSDILFFVNPLYLDSAPSSMVEVMEFLNKMKKLICRPKKMFVLSICGFPETSHNDTALRIYKCFARDMDFMWLGGMATGASFSYLYGKKIFSIIGMYRRLDRSICLTANALEDDKVVPEEAIGLIQGTPFPDWLYTKAAIFVAIVLAIKDGVWNLYKRPYDLEL